MIKRTACLILCCCLISSGCAPLDTASNNRINIRRFLVLPFSHAPKESWEDFRQNLIIDLLAYSDLVILNREITMDDIKKSGVKLGESFGSLDYMLYPSNLGRIKKLRKEYNADTIIYGAFFEGSMEMTIHLQVIDLLRQELLVSIIRDIPADEFKKRNLQKVSKESAKQIAEYFQKDQNDGPENYLWRYNQTGR